MLILNSFLTIFFWLEADRYETGSFLWWGAMLLSTANAASVVLALTQPS